MMAPRAMKSFVMAGFLGMSAVGSLLGMGLAPWARDPGLVWVYAGLGGLCFITGCVFWRVFGGLTKEGAEGGDEGVGREREREV